MNYFITRITSLVLVFGFFISCSTLSSSTEPPNPSEDLSEKQLQQRIDSLNKEIETGKVSADNLYQKGTLLTALAQKKEDPTQRTPIYRQAHQTLNKASERFAAENMDTEKPQEVLQVSWSNEHNQGVQIMQGDSVDTNPDYRQAATHFQNATVILPDSAISYQMEARAYYNEQEIEQAIHALERAQVNITKLPLSALEQLAFLYLEDERPDEAINIYEQAKPFAEQNLNLLHGLSNAYMSADQHHKAVDILEVLAENRPKNILYGQSLATELFHIATEKMDTVITGLNNGKDLEPATLSEIDSLLSKAEEQYAALLNDNPENEELKLNFAHFYQNSGAIYQQLLPLLSGAPKQEVEEKIQQHLMASLPLYEDLAEKNEAPDIWKTIYQIYSYLGMPEEARNAKANF